MNDRSSGRQSTTIRMSATSAPRALRVCLVDARGRAFERPNVRVCVTLEKHDDDGDADDAKTKMMMKGSSDARVGDERRAERVIWTSSGACVFHDASNAEVVVVTVEDGDAGTIARGECRLAGGRARARGDAVVPGRWCVVRGVGEDGSAGDVVGEVCVRVTAVKMEGDGTRADGGDGVARARSEAEGAVTAAEAASGKEEEVRSSEVDGGGIPQRALGGVNVAVGWLRGLARRQNEDDDARAAEKEARRRERETQIEEKRVQKERERIEREEAQAAERARRSELERLRAEEKRQWDAERAEEKRRREEERAADRTTRAEGADEASPTQRMPWNRTPRDDASSAQSSASGARNPIHMPNVEEIKHAVREGAHQLGEVAHHMGEVAHHIAHDVSEHAHHVGDALREKNERLGKALAKKRWIRDIASKVSPNALLVAAIAVLLAGLPENRKRAKQKVRSLANRPVGSFGAARSLEEEMEPEDDWQAEIVYNLNDAEEEDPPYIGRGPTPRGVYEVVEGDTLCSIAGCFNLDVVEIIDRNGDVIKNPEELSPGARIRIY